MAATPSDSGSESPSSSPSNSTCPACGEENVRLKNVNGMLICDKCASKKFSSTVRKSIQEAFDKQQNQMRKEAYARRLQITKQAYNALTRNKPLEAVQLYEKYLEVLNTRFRTTSENLHRHLFDSKKDEQELMLVTAVFWDLARTLDKIDGHENKFRLYLRKYVDFSIGAKYMVLSAETLRKYIKDGKCKHIKDFEQAHVALRTKLGKCFIAGALYGEDAAETLLLRKLRDERLEPTIPGRAFVRAYYALAPLSARWFASRPRASAWAARLISATVLPIARQWITVPTRDGRK